MVNSALFIGCGDIATRAALMLQPQSIEVLGVRRNISALDNTLPAVAADVLKPDTLNFLKDANADTVVYSLAASGFSEENYRAAYVDGLKNIIHAIDLTRVKRLVFVSSTSVYHQNDGSTVTETSKTLPKYFNGRIMLEAERLALQTNIATVLRYSGIYGPGRTRMIDRVRNGLCTPENTETYTNRIHVELVIGSDSNPATANDVESFIAQQLGIKKRYADANNKKPKRIAGSKRCSNALMLNSGYKLQHPDFRTGYQQAATTFSRPSSLHTIVYNAGYALMSKQPLSGYNCTQRRQTAR